MANFASKENTLLAGVAQTFNFKQLLGVNASSLVYSNDDASATHTLTIDGQSFTVKPGEQRVLSGVQNWDVLTIGGDAGSTGAYRVYASSDLPAPLFYKPYGGPITTTAIADGAVTDAKLAVGAHVASAGVLSTPFPVETLVLDAADIAVSPSDIDYTALVGKHEILSVAVTNTAVSNAGNKFVLKTSAGTAITTDITPGAANGDTAVAANLKNMVLASGAGLKLTVTKAGGSTAARVTIQLMKVA